LPCDENPKEYAHQSQDYYQNKKLLLPSDEMVSNVDLFWVGSWQKYYPTQSRKTRNWSH